METPVYSKAPVDSLAEQLREGHVLGLSPGGVYEAQFGDNNYRLLWKEGLGFARAALQVTYRPLGERLHCVVAPPPTSAHGPSTLTPGGRGPPRPPWRSPRLSPSSTGSSSGRRGRRTYPVPLLPPRDGQGRQAQGVQEEDEGVRGGGDGLPTLQILRAHRGDGVGDRGVAASSSSFPLSPPSLLLLRLLFPLFLLLLLPPSLGLPWARGGHARGFAAECAVRMARAGAHAPPPDAFHNHPTPPSRPAGPNHTMHQSTDQSSASLMVRSCSIPSPWLPPGRGPGALPYPTTYILSCPVLSCVSLFPCLPV